MTTFAHRKINLRFTLDAPSGVFKESGTNTVDLTGLRVKATLAANSSVSMNQCNLEIYGMPLGLMNQLTVLQNGYTQGIFNQVEVTAGDDNAMALIFSGGIYTGWADAQSQPDVAFVVQAFTELQNAYLSVPPTVFNGSVDAATIAASIAAQMQPPLTLQNSGVNAQITDPHYRGDPLAQLRQLSRDADFEYGTDITGVLAIWPRGQARDTVMAPTISKDTGLIGYPAYNDRGIMFSTLFNPGIVVNGPVSVESGLTPANGTWYPFTVQHVLESEQPNGDWFTHVEAQKFTGQGDQQLLPGEN